MPRRVRLLPGASVSMKMVKPAVLWEDVVYARADYLWTEDEITLREQEKIMQHYISLLNDGLKESDAAFLIFKIYDLFLDTEISGPFETVSGELV